MYFAYGTVRTFLKAHAYGSEVVFINSINFKNFYCRQGRKTRKKPMISSHSGHNIVFQLRTMDADSQVQAWYCYSMKILGTTNSLASTVHPYPLAAP